MTSATDVRATLMYAGDIRGRARFDVVDPQKMNVAFIPFEADIHDARAARERLTLDSTGFTYTEHRSAFAQSEDLFESNLARNVNAGGDSVRYLAEVAEFLQSQTGASQVLPQIGGLLVRTSTRAKRKSWAVPANFVHLDFTADSADRFLRWSVDAAEVPMPSYRRYVIYQSWRALSPGPQDSALCICDGSSVPPSDGIVVDSVVGAEDEPGGQFESRLCLPNAGHRWYYLADMAPHDLLLFKGFDSDTPEAMNAMHTAFDNPLAGPEAIPRRSVEARFIAFFS